MSSSTFLNHTTLTGEQRAFLESLPCAEDDDQSFPIYVREGDKFTFIQDCKPMSSSNGKFEKAAPAGLYRGGAVIIVRYDGGTLVVPDDRYGWWKPFTGIAQHDEGPNLILTGIRELIEEAFVYDLKKTKRFVPTGARLDCERLCSLGFIVTEVVEVGKISHSHYAVNEKNRAYEAVLVWDITGIRDPFSVSLEEEWFSGDHTGIPVYQMQDDGVIRGVWSGQQGLLELPKFGIHPTLRSHLSL